MRRSPPPLAVFLLALIALPGAAAIQAPDAAAADEVRRIGRVAVKDDGFYRVPHEALRALGAHGAPRVSVTRLGRPVPYLVSDRALVFLAQRHQTNASAFGVYEFWLHDGDAPQVVSAPRTLTAGGAKPPRARRYLDVDRVHGALEAARTEVYGHVHAPTWYVTRILPGRSTATDLDPAGAAPGADQTLRVHVFATRIGTVALKARWGEHDLGVATQPSAAGGATFTWKVPGAAVPAEGTALLLEDVSPPAPPAEAQDISDHRGTLWVDSLQLAGPVRPVIDGGLRRFTIDDGSALELRSLSTNGTKTVYVAAVDPIGQPVTGWRWGRIGEDLVRVEAGGVDSAAELCASTHAVDVKPEAVRERADPMTATRAASHVILAVPELVDAAKTLARHRAETGILSSVVPVVDVYDAYGYGEPSAAAIRAFLVDLMQRDVPTARYVLLAGEAMLDRTDMAPFTTIPAPMARTKYNGATAADRLYALPVDGSPTGGLEIGRLPFREAGQLEAYVKRVIEYETKPPADPTRRLLRFVTNESRFGAFIDRLLESVFSTIVTNHIPPAFDIAITFASKASPYLWPPLEMNDHVIDGFNEGCLFYTYVGHGFGRGFDRLRIGDKHFPVLHVNDAPRIECRGTPPIVFVIACTTAIFDHPGYEGIGETLLARPRGPIAYWGATRICHPAANTLLGRAITKYIAKREGDWRLGDILGRARDEVLAPPASDTMRGMINIAIRSLAKGSDPERLALEGSWMYSLLGDPALKVAFPMSDLDVQAKVTDDDEVRIEVRGAIDEEAEVHITLEAPRNDPWQLPEKVEDPLDPAQAELIRDNHKRVNSLPYAEMSVTLEGGHASVSISLPEGIRQKPASKRKVVVKAWAVTDTQVHQGGVMLDVPEAKKAPKKPSSD